MLIKNKKKYTLSDIERLYSQIPLIFIIVIALLSFLITFFILDSKQSREIDLLKQKYFLNYEFTKKEEITTFTSYIDKKLKNSFSKEEIHLKNITYKVVGFLQANELKDKKNLDKYIKNIENTNDLNIVIFTKDDLKILYGENSILYLQNLIYSYKDKKYKEFILKYIYSQGNDNLQYWKDDVARTVRLSFFDKLTINNKEYFIGSFSTINSIKEITKTAIINAINNKNFKIWFYDIISQKTYNFNGNKKYEDSNEIFKNKKYNKSYEIIKHYLNNFDYSDEFKNFSYFYDKFDFLVSAFYDKSIIENQLKDTIYKIKKDYRNLLFRIFMYILVGAGFLILLTYLFTSFIKNIITEYNDELEDRRVSLIHWKKRFELAIIASNDGLWDIDFKTKKIYFSDKWLDMFGYEKEELQTFSDWFELIHNEDKVNVEKLFDKIFAKADDTFICEYRLKTKSEGFKWVLARGKSFLDENNELDRMLMMSMDIDKNKRMKKELLDIELLVEDGKIVIFKLLNDENLSVQYISNSIQTFGFSKNMFEKENMRFMNLIHKEDVANVQVAINAAVKKDLQNFTFTCRIINAANEVRWISSRVILIKNHSGQVSHFYGYLNDITKIKLSEEELKLKVEEELAKNREKDRILIQQNKLAAMGEMLGNIAHQWRQPLNNVSLILQFLRDNYKNKDVNDEKLDKFMNKANKHIEYMSETIDDFRNFYKPSKTKNEFYVNECIDTLLYMVKNQYESQNIKINFEYEEVKIINYENELKQALLNILNNAKDALLMRKEKENFEAHIDITLKKDNEKMNIEITNNGGNIDEEILYKIYEPYFTTKFEMQGTGIGLYMTKSIIETNMKGKIEVENISEGVKFIITLNI
ncbi:multi-sensor signal transduction histidine kinase [Arcobacter nitrofigilis DSM 7299]|uniref:histidine kinase n=1 Tax=Arcobacter nitrofigilis (strain ATCC 33309 / DSM 7299 / CCUG 15893 / LMG 7604 / NCTC 12251 / CI) TaxID=572480 RepID=D5V433_ARCNC|nr:PAS domain-containing sensor histidine kinase [Arcobacter nitrofigilis]ADG92861.1 multi-sensor signal transduction histidine kinase [Arcobacter nitrofigilis DSM 7299]